MGEVKRKYAFVSLAMISKVLLRFPGQSFAMISWPMFEISFPGPA